MRRNLSAVPKSPMLVTLTAIASFYLPAIAQTTSPRLSLGSLPCTKVFAHITDRSALVEMCSVAEMECPTESANSDCFAKIINPRPSSESARTGKATATKSNLVIIAVPKN
jgi:hypothetical protein